MMVFFSLWIHDTCIEGGKEGEGTRRVTRERVSKVVFFKARSIYGLAGSSLKSCAEYSSLKLSCPQIILL